MALEHGLATLVMDGPGTGENPFPYEPESVVAWKAAVDYLAARPEVDAGRIGAFGISRGGHSVMLLAGSYPEKVRAAVASAGHHFGYRMTEAEMENYVANRNRRASYIFGAPGDGPSFPAHHNRERSKRCSSAGRSANWISWRKSSAPF